MRRLAQFILWFMVPLVFIMVVLFCLTGPLSGLVYHPQLPQQKQRIVIGNSHPECAFIEGQEWPWINLGKSGECFFYSFPKAKWLIENNPQIKEVWIDLSPNQLMPHMHEWIHDEEHVQRSFLSYSHIHDLAWNYSAFVDFPKPTMSTKMVQVQRFLGAILKPQWEQNRIDLKWGGYNKLVGSKEAFESEVHGADRLQPDAENWRALKEFCEWAHDQKIEIHAVVCPHYSSNKEVETQQKVFQFCQSRNLAISNYHFIDFPFSEKELFYDASHLNHKGALIYSKLIRSLCDSLSHQKALH
jgi:hypothetical protein